MIEKVVRIEYLGVTIINRGDEEKGSTAACMLSKILKSKNIARFKIIRLYQSIVTPTVVCACETWTLNKRDLDKLEA